MKRTTKAFLGVVAVLIIVAGFIGFNVLERFNSAEQTIKELSEQTSASNQKIEELSVLLEDASNEIERADRTIKKLNAIIEDGGIVLKKAEGNIHISATLYTLRYTDIPYYTSVDEALENNYRFQSNSYVTFYIEGLEKAKDINCTITRHGETKDFKDCHINNDGLVVLGNEVYVSVSLITISYTLNGVPCELYFPVSCWS